MHPASGEEPPANPSCACGQDGFDDGAESAVSGSSDHFVRIPEGMTYNMKEFI